MAFLTINGLTVPIERGGQVTRDKGEKIVRALDGTGLSGRRFIKRMWSFITTSMEEMEALQLAGLLDALGQHWNWEFDETDTGLLTPIFFSTKGLPFGSTVGGVRWGLGADGAAVMDNNEKAESKYGNGALAVEQGSDNLLSNNQADVEGDTTGFAVVAGGAIAVDATHKLQGSQSLKVTASAIADGAKTTSIAASASTVYTVSVYFKPTDATTDLQLTINDDDVGEIDVVGVTASATKNGKWIKVDITGTTGASATAVWMEFTAAGATVFYCDAFQIEQSSVGTTWIDPAGALRAAGDLKVSATFLNAFDDLTVTAWVKAPTANPAANAYLALIAGATTSNLIAIVRASGTNDIRFQTNDEDAAIDTITYASSPWDGDWHMATAVFRTNPETGEVKKRLYFDGVSVGTSDPAKMPVLSTVTDVHIGNNSGTQNNLGLIDELQVVPYAMTAAMVAALFNRTTARPNMPKLELAGDVIAETTIDVIGDTKATRFTGRESADGWKSNHRKTQFDLWEA